MNIRRIAFGIIFAFLLSLSSSAYAGDATEQIRGTIDTILKILQDKELKKPEKAELRRKKIRKTVDEKFDFEEMAKRALGVHWQARTPQEQKEFTGLFSDLLESSYIRKIERYENERVDYISEKTDGQYSTVKTKIVTAKELQIPVDYRIIRRDSKYCVYDIVVEGVSLVNNYRTQFNQVIKSSSYEDLVKRIRAKKITEPS